MKFSIITKIYLLNFFLIGFFFSSSSLISAQNYQLKKDSIFIKNFQIEFNGKKNFLFISNEGFASIPLQNISDSDSIVILDLDTKTNYTIYKEELKVRDSILFFSTGKAIEPVIMNHRKTETIIGIDNKGRTSKLYITPDIIRIVEIPKSSSYENKKIKKIRYYFTSGNHPITKTKIIRENTKINPILYTCKTVDCINPKNLISETEVSFIEKNKYLEIDLSHKNIVINENFENIYVGFESLGYYVTKMKKVDKIGSNKCFNAGKNPQWYRQSSYKCPIISVVIE